MISRRKIRNFLYPHEQQVEHAFGRISVDLYREAADTLRSRSINGPGVSMPSLQFLKKGRFFIDRLDRRQRIRIESRRYLHPSTPGRRFNTSFVRVFSGIDNDSPRSSFHRNSSLFASSIHFARARDLYWYTRVPPEVVFGATILWEVEGRFECDSLLKETVDVEVVRSRSCMTDA